MIFYIFCSLFVFISCDDFEGSIEVKPVPAKFMRVHVEHDIGNQFIQRSTFTLQQKRINSKVESGIETHPSTGDQAANNGIVGSDVDNFKELLKNNGLYRIRLLSKAENLSSPYIYAAIPACELQKSGFKEEITLHLDKNDGVISVEYSSPVTALARPCDPSKVAESVTFQTKLKVADRLFVQSLPLNIVASVPGNSPASPNPAAVQRDEHDPADSDGPKPPPRQSLLAQYWYIVLPMTIMFLFGSPPPEQKKGGEAGGGTEGSGAVKSAGSGTAGRQKK